MHLHGLFSTRFTRAESIPLRAYLARWSTSPVAIIRVISPRCRCLSELTGGAGTGPSMSLRFAWGCALAEGSKQAREPRLPHVAWGCSVALGSSHARPRFGGCGLFGLGWAEGPGCSQLRVLVLLSAPPDTGLQWACVSCDAASQPHLPVMRLPTPAAALAEEDVAPGFNQERYISKLHVPRQALARATASLSRPGWHV